MDAEITFSEAKICPECGDRIRVRYLNGEFYDIVEVDPIDDIPINPIYPIHNCK